MKDKLDRYYIGILMGLALPALFGWLYISNFHLRSALDAVNWHGAVSSQLCLLACFPDLALLFLFYTLDLWNIAKGLVFGMLPYMLLSIILSM